MISKVKLGTSKKSAEDKKRLFAEAYLSNGGNATQAALAVGYKRSGAQKQGYRMSRDPLILSIIEQRQGEVIKKLEINTENILAELAKIAFSDPRQLFDEQGRLKDPKDWPDGMAGAIASVEVEELFEGTGRERSQIGYTKKLKLWDKNSAIEKAMKFLRMLGADHVQVNVNFFQAVEMARERVINGRG